MRQLRRMRVPLLVPERQQLRRAHPQPGFLVHFADHRRSRRLICAAPAYLERRGAPGAPADLAAHDCLGFSGLHSHPEWKLTGQGEQPVRVRGALVSNDNEALLCTARLGLGIFAAGGWLMSRDLDAGPPWQRRQD
ncbi:TPA: hypothetical protein L6A27_04760 [Pseudomonas aeruginosa]|nr:hypothetical protein B7D75_18045 [Pseudomonas paraeruginosa]MBG7008193.1 hypothetical protein [Pseudomonas aeruginosa]MBG7023195.1 hypothetical protein [Pseudomonas aeruginosa]MBG7369006.1 hypothetical protein [Pseudomonas aeruginosa]MBM9932283.1 hypothetical protein [Pseudomonas aeruginosa]